MVRLGQYELLEEIARGGMGVVYRARGPLGDVAIKRVNASGADLRLIQEARAAHALRHPAIVATHHIDADPRGCPYLVMELVDGESLGQRLKREGPLPVDEAVRLTRQVCEALDHAHARGVIHRDIKPDNVLIERATGQAKLADFGLGKILAESQALTESGSTLGTPGYMPPEQVEGDKRLIGPQSDVYGVGALLFGLLAGQAPFQGTTIVNTLYAVLHHPAPRVRSLRPEVPEHLESLLESCLHKDPECRPPGAEAVSAALAACLGPSTSSNPPTRASGARSLLLSAVFALLGLGGALVMFTSATQPPLTAESSPTPAPQPPSAYERGLSAYRQRDYSRAIAALTESLPALTGAKLANARYYRAAARQRAADYAGALRDLDHLLTDTPDELRCLQMRATCLAALGQDADALRVVDRAVELDPESYASYGARAIVHQRADRQSKRLEDLQRAAQLAEAQERPDAAASYYKAAAYVWLNDSPTRSARQALELYERAATLAEPDWWLYFYRARARHEVGRYADALADLDRAKALEDDEGIDDWHRGKRYTRRGQIHKDQKNWVAALEDLSHAVRLNKLGVAESLDAQGRPQRGRDKMAYFFRAVARDTLGDIAGACRDYEEVIEITQEAADRNPNQRLRYRDQSQRRLEVLRPLVEATGEARAE